MRTIPNNTPALVLPLLSAPACTGLKPPGPVGTTPCVGAGIVALPAFAPGCGPGACPPPGAPGAAGAFGAPGTTGAIGAIGATGATGATGPTGGLPGIGGLGIGGWPGPPPSVGGPKPPGFGGLTSPGFGPGFCQPLSPPFAHPDATPHGTVSVTEDSPFLPHFLQVCVTVVMGTLGLAHRAQSLSVVQYSCVTSRAGFVGQTAVYVIVVVMVCVRPGTPPRPGAGGGFTPGAPARLT